MSESFRLFVSHAFLSLCYIPVLVSPYIAVYPCGYLKDIIPSSVILIFQCAIIMGELMKTGKKRRAITDE